MHGVNAISEGPALTDADAMSHALELARAAGEAGEVPVGAVVVVGGRIVGAAGNRREATGDPTAHAEILALREAAALLGSWRLAGASLLVTVEPCPMCAGAVVLARLERIVFGARDGRAGCAGSVYRIPEDPAFNHFARCDGGLLAEECGALLQKFFRII